jgi:hypothetical protein
MELPPECVTARFALWRCVARSGPIGGVECDPSSGFRFTPLMGACTAEVERVESECPALALQLDAGMQSFSIDAASPSNDPPDAADR